MLSIALGCARSRLPEGEGGRDGAVVGSDGSTIDPSTDGGAETRDGAVVDPDPTRDAGRARDAGPPPSPEAVALARRECEWEATCNPGVVDFAFFAGMEGCVAAMAETLDPLLARGHAAPPSEWCSATRARDADCDGFRDDDGRAALDCVEPPGRLRSGEACLDDRECGRSATGGQMRCLDCQCRPLLREGDDCSRDECQTELVCSPDGFGLSCARLGNLPEGARCSDESPSTWCAQENRCIDGVCVRRPRLGEVCVPGSGVSCFDPRSTLGVCERDEDGEHRCRRANSFPPTVAAGARCERGDTCVGGAACPLERVCPTRCVEAERYEESTCALGACNEATGECAFPSMCVDR
ncbi:MAG: hypothetical protein H6722_14575 [Sandaracinus sp.]|nr:hypothetical protein [Sandaracinus sp.]